MLSTPLVRTNSAPAMSPAMPGILCVPASSISGRKSGIVWLRLSEPVPPAMSGFAPSRQSRTPVP